MKSLLHLFTVYMLVLSLLPCGDGGGGIVELTKHFFGIEHQHVADHVQHSNTCGDDNCPPFCICTCCSSAVDTPVTLTVLIDTPSQLPGTSPSFVPNFIHSLHPTAVWQPPQFS